MENVGVQQARQMAELWGRRADLVEQLNNLDGQIAALMKVRFTTKCEIEVFDTFDEALDEGETSTEVFNEGDEAEFDILCSKGEVFTPSPAAKTEVAQKIATNGQRRKKKRGPGRPKGSRNKPKTDQPVATPEATPEAPAEAPAPAVAIAAPPEDMTASGKRFRNRVSLRELICTVAQQHDGIKLDDLVQACYEAGYRSTSDRKGFVQNIRTNLNSLMNDGKMTKDDDKRYHVAAA